ncbi:hypothetical protein [Vagococcus fluvialis]|uniref:Uncharacterized protein n=1 Tax=Vagococcus fluvialis TaxID=2738 RepID=A0A7X6I220_9ENTE|nr:hypothetical protein [Vagococcus fluvialis]NKC66730.1 hypothetical protein [Vagococcus fluvialis]
MSAFSTGDRVVIKLSNISFHLPGTIVRQSELQFDSDLRYVIELDTGKYVSLPSSRIELYDDKLKQLSKEYNQMIK